MPKFIKINNKEIVKGKKIHFDKGDTIIISYKKEILGFGLHFAPTIENQAFNLRSVNSSVGLNTYAPSQRFSLDGNRIIIHSKGDETIEVNSDKFSKKLIIRAKHKGYLTHDSNRLEHYRAPSWAYDYWFSTPWTRMDQQTVLNEINTAHNHHLGPKVWLLDAGWSSSSNYLDFDKKKFTEGNNFLKTMNKKGVKPILWMAPFIDSDTRLWVKFNKNNWLVKDASGKSSVFTITGDNLSTGSYIDFTSASFIEHLSQKLCELKALGLGGLMFDFGEALPDDSRFCLETESSKLAKKEDLIGHNWYVGEIKRVLHEIASPLDLCLISRSGWSDSHSKTGLWLGDQSSDSSRFAGLESVLWGYKTACEAGYRFVGMDVGGYFGSPSVKDYERWLDLSVTMPFTMLHGATQANPWELGAEALSCFRKARKKHNKLWRKPENVRLTFKLSKNKQRITHIKANRYRFKNNSTD